MRYTSLPLISVGIFFVVFLMPCLAYADQYQISGPIQYQPSLPALSDQETNARITTATELLQSQQKGAEYWEYGWGAFDFGTMSLSAVEASHEANHENRATDIVQASESLVGLADVVFRPLPAFNANTSCSQTAHTAQDRADCLASEEDLLQRSAERAQDPYKWLPHLGNLGFNVLAGLIVSKVGNSHNALMTAVPGEIIGEVQLWTTPQEPTRDYNRYKMQFSPLLVQSNNTRDTTAGFKMTMNF